MAHTTGPAGRTLWVRFAARVVTRRQVAFFQVSGLAGVAAIGLIVAAVESGGDSVLGRLGFWAGVAAACLGVGGTVWAWLAIRWVDHHGQWGQTA